MYLGPWSNIMGIPWKILFPMGIWHIWLATSFSELGVLDPKFYELCILKIPRLNNLWFQFIGDGSVLGNLGKAGGGGLIKDHEVNWIKGFVRSLGSTNSFAVELWALRDDLIPAEELRITSDCRNLSNMLMEQLLTDCRNLLRAIPTSEFSCADALAKFGAGSQSLCIF